MTTITLNTREAAAILAGLRLIQRELPRSQFLPQGVHDIYDNGGDIVPLNEDEIDTLCEQINCAPDAITYTQTDENGEIETVTLSPAQHKLAAIRATILGHDDHPALSLFGPNHPAAESYDPLGSKTDDILHIINA